MNIDPLNFVRPCSSCIHPAEWRVEYAGETRNWRGQKRPLYRWTASQGLLTTGSGYSRTYDQAVSAATERVDQLEAAHEQSHAKPTLLAKGNASGTTWRSEDTQGEAEVARLAGVSRMTVRAWLGKGQ